jgi:DNA polymerase-3 subunit epsilon
LDIRDEVLIAFDTETTGAYPINWEVCEIAAVKWVGGKITDSFASLIKPDGPMNPIAQSIHKITMDELVTAPKAREVYAKFLDFIEGGVLLAHHAPFDLGFVAAGLEKNGLDLPKNRVVCTSLMSRKVIKGTLNHRLQTLVQSLGLKTGNAHRALEDAENALGVGLHCFSQMPSPTFESVSKVVGMRLNWSDYSINEVEKKPALSGLVKACRNRDSVEFVYKKGSSPGRARVLQTDGIVRNPMGDYFVGIELGQPKRFYLNSIESSKYETL